MTDQEFFAMCGYTDEIPCTMMCEVWGECRYVKMMSQEILDQKQKEHQDLQELNQQGV